MIQGNGSTIRRASSAPQFRIVAVESTGDLTLQDTTLSGGAAAGDGARPGGGVFNDDALTLINSTVSGNSAGTYGGGVSNTGTLTLTNSTVSGNSARYGGGVLSAGTLTLTNSTVSGNSAFGDGGGVFTSGTLTLDQSLVSGNSASSQGPEVFNSVFQTFPGTVITNGFNPFGYDGSAGVTGFTPGMTDIVPAVPLSAILDPTLADNGGPTRTHALVIGSQAIDAIPAASCATIADQRSVTRPRDGDEDTLADCDIGAFELQLPSPPPPPLPPPPPPAAATAADQDPRVQCVGFDCRVLIKCDAVQGSTEPCNTRVDVFIRTSALRLGEDGAAKARRRIRFAGAVTNIPPGGTTNLRLTLTRR
ncbi:MAG: choice-of-anchor Q domain-containing protein, partial [Gammaproteobacteria bacterium]